MEFIPLMVELVKDANAVFKDNPVELFTRGTGGREFSFSRQRELEEAIQRIGEELHGQYLISYSPNNKDQGGYHQIIVTVAGRTSVVRIQTRPGYWLAVTTIRSVFTYSMTWADFVSTALIAAALLAVLSLSQGANSVVCSMAWMRASSQYLISGPDRFAPCFRYSGRTLGAAAVP